MNIKIKKLSPYLAEDYANFFDVTPHSNHPDDDSKKCYCVWSCNDAQDRAFVKNFLSSPNLRREYAVKNIKSNNIQGYLAYFEDKVVGWCNANTKADCLKCYCGPEFAGSVTVEELERGIRIKSIFCFLIALEMRRKGITKLLLERVCQDSVHDDFDFVESYPRKKFLNEARDYMGPAEVFKKCGFIICAETEDRFIMRKYLK